MNAQKPLKLLLIADFHHFSTKDMFTGYIESLKLLGIPFQIAETYELVDTNKVCHMSPDAAIGLILAKLMNVENEFTHCLIISGIAFPEWFYKTCKYYGISVSVIASDDPHASTPLVKIKPYLDYWFTNEKTLEDIPNKIVYVPTATSSYVPNCTREQVLPQYKHDVVFVGTIYPDRVGPLEEACMYCEANGLKIGIFGGLVVNLPEDHIIKRHLTNGIIDNNDTKMLYRGAKVVLNIDRNIHWNPNERVGNSTLVGDKEAYSMNPRAYEVALCKTLQLYIDARQEAHDVFGDNIQYTQSNFVAFELKYIFEVMKQEEYDNKVLECFDRVKNGHLYLYRAQKIINCLTKGETNE